MDTTPAPDELTPRARLVKELRRLADLYEQLPTLDVPDYVGLSFRYYTGQPVDKAVAQVAAIAREMGPVTKEADDLHFTLQRDVGPARVRFAWPRGSVCEQQTVTKTVTEWVCPDSFLALAEAADAESGVPA